MLGETDGSLVAPAAAHHRIGPNAVTRLASAIRSQCGADTLRGVFADAGLCAYLGTPPTDMVDEGEVCRLHRALRGRVDYQSYRSIARFAGSLTGDYLIANRIPALAVSILPRLPAVLAARILTRAINRNAWTFVGSGRFFSLRQHGQPVLVIEHSPLARDCSLPGPACDYYAGTFERLYQRLLGNSGLTLQETSCIAQGADCCRFEFN